AVTTLIYLADLFMVQKLLPRAEAPLRSCLALCEGLIHVAGQNGDGKPQKKDLKPFINTEAAQAEILAAYCLRQLAKIYYQRGRHQEAKYLAQKATGAFTGALSEAIKLGHADFGNLNGNNNAAVAEAKREILNEATSSNNLFYKITDGTGD